MARLEKKGLSTRSGQQRGRCAFEAHRPGMSSLRHSSLSTKRPILKATKGARLRLAWHLQFAPWFPGMDGRRVAA